MNPIKSLCNKYRLNYDELRLREILIDQILTQIKYILQCLIINVILCCPPIKYRLFKSDLEIFFHSN